MKLKTILEQILNESRVDILAILDGLEDIILSTESHHSSVSFKLHEAKQGYRVYKFSNKLEDWEIIIQYDINGANISSEYNLLEPKTHKKYGRTWNSDPDNTSSVPTLSTPKEDSEHRKFMNRDFYISTDSKKHTQQWTQFVKWFEEAMTGFPEDY